MFILMDFEPDIFHTAPTLVIYHWVMNGLRAALQSRTARYWWVKHWILASYVHLQPRKPIVSWAAEKL